jgi:hypothetical protein
MDLLAVVPKPAKDPRLEQLGTVASGQVMTLQKETGQPVETVIDVYLAAGRDKVRARLSLGTGK